MLNDFIFAFQLMALAIVIAEMEPLQELIDVVFERWLNNRPVYDDLHSALSCYECLTFWITLTATLDILMTATVTSVAILLRKIIFRR